MFEPILVFILVGQRGTEKYHLSLTMICFCVRLQIKQCTKCPRLSQQLERAITTVFKPVANHDFNVISQEEENGSIGCPQWGGRSARC